MTKDKIISIVCEVCEVEPRDVTGKSLAHNITMARHLAQWFLYWHCKMTIEDVANATGVTKTAPYIRITPRLVCARKHHEPTFKARFCEIENRLKKSR